MMHHLNPADELAHIRAEMKRLKSREAELRAAFLTDPEMPRIGRWHKVDLLTERRTVFEPRLLPADIRNDPRFLRDRVTRVLRTARHVSKPESAPIEAGHLDALAMLRPAPRTGFLAGLLH